MNANTTIYFVFPYRGVGGVSLLFLRLAHAIAQNFNHRCVLVDYVDGYMATRANHNIVEVQHYTDDDKIDISGNSIALFQTMTPWSIFPGLSIADEVRVLFWNCHPSNLAVEIPGLRNVASPILKFLSNSLLHSYRLQARKFTTQLFENRSIIFMDFENLHSARKATGLSLEKPVYVPIPAKSYELRYIPCADDEAVLHLCWIGRIVDFKFFILKRLIDDLSKLSQEQQLKLTVIGNGSHLKKLKECCELVNNYQINFIEHLEEPELNEFLVSEVDILYAMGTSALEGAKFGVPVILLDISYVEVPETYVYRWLFERDGSTLGEILRNYNSSGSSLNSLRDLFKDFSVSKEAVSLKTYSYFQKNHAIDMVIKRLLNALQQSKCLWGDLKSEGLLKKGYVYPMLQKTKRLIK